MVGSQGPPVGGVNHCQLAAKQEGLACMSGPSLGPILEGDKKELPMNGSGQYRWQNQLAKDLYEFLNSSNRLGWIIVLQNDQQQTPSQQRADGCV
mmetsp:Transcript_41497/g.74446  ORF Transcript_41497/g.74446 Transcript_41497/m.74446 type:complete len:95 (+) Transcript_41497:101-385(+)